MPRLRSSIVVIGDEILAGYVRDTNSGWLAERLRAHGVPLDRVVTVPDQVDAIVDHLDAELDRSRPRLVLTSGGIGSTPDDLTMEAVAAQRGVGLVIDPQLDEMITGALDPAAGGGTADAERQAAVRSMARVPDGAHLLTGAVGSAPAVAVDVDGGLEAGGATIVVLPGVPGQLRRITETSVEPMLLAGRGRLEHTVELTHPYPESVLSPLLTQLTGEFPDVHVGSYPGKDCLVRLTGPQPRVEAAAERVRGELDRVAAEPGSDEMAARWQEHWSPNGA